MVEYGETLRFEDFNTLPGFTADVHGMLSTAWTRIGTKVVPAGIEIAIGRKFDGYACVIMNETNGTIFYGKIRITATDPQEYRKVVLLDFNTRTTTDMADKTKKKLLPLTKPGVGKDGKLILEIWPESTCKIDYGATLSAIDVTVKVIR